MATLRKFLYLDESTLDDYVGALEDGLLQSRQTTQGTTTSKSGGIDAKVVRGELGGGRNDEEVSQYADTAPAKFNRLLELARADEEAVGWVELQTLEQLSDVGFGAIVHLECEAYVPTMIRLLASGDLGDAIGMVQSLSGFTDVFGIDMEGMPGADELAGIEALTGVLKSDMVFVGEDDASDWKIAGKLTKTHLRESDVEGYVRVVGKVSKRWSVGEWKPLMALPGASLLSRAERRKLEREAPEDKDDDSSLEGPAVMIDVLAIYR